MAVDKNKIVAEATRFAQRGQYDKALKAYEKILAEDRKEVRTLLKVGEIHQKKGDVAAAAQTFNQVAEIYGEQGFFLKAVAVYKQIAKLAPDDVRVNEKLAGLYQQLGLLNDATNQLQIVATAYESAGDQGRHLDVLRRLLDLDPENVATCQRLGNLYAKAGRNAEALELYRRAAAHLRENRRGDEYVKVAERIFHLTPDDLRLARELAQEYLARGDAKKALGKLQVCHGADKQDVDTLRLMAQAFRDLGQVSKTIAVYRALARVYAERGRREEAATTWRMVLELLPDDPEAKDELAAAGAAARPGAVAPAQPAAGTSAPVPAAAAAATVRPGAGPATPPPGRPPGAARPPPVMGGTPPPVVGVAPRPRPGPGAPAVTPAPAASVPGPQEAGLAASRILTEADVYVKYGLLAKALDHVRKILVNDPGNPDALERVRDIQDALGDRAGAAEAAEQAVKALLERGDEARIAHATERLRALDPSHAEVEVDVEPPVPEVLPPPDDETSAVEAGPADEPGTPDAVQPGVGSDAGAEAEPPLVVPPDEEGPRAVGGLEGPRPVVDDELPGGVPAYAAPVEGSGEPARAAPEGEDEATPVVLGDATPLPIDDTGVEIDVAPPEAGGDEPVPVPGDEEPIGLPPEVAPEPPPPALAGQEREAHAETVPERGLEGAPQPEVVEAVDLRDLGQHGEVGEGGSVVDVADVGDVVEVGPEAVEEVSAAAAPPPLPEPAEPVRAPARPPPDATPHPASPVLERRWPALDAELEELEFYERQGLREEAMLAAQELAAAHPGHPALGPVLARVEAMSGEWSISAAAAQAAAPPAAPPPAPVDDLVPQEPTPEGARPGSTGTTGIFDLGAELSAELGPELTPSPSGEFQYSVADVFDQFKRGLERTVRPDDSATKYDLGIAFQEMGMLDEALEQFRSALAGGDRHREVEILSMIGNCLGLKGDHAGAVEAYRQALRSEFLTGPAAKAIHFELGAAHEAMGEPDVGLWYFQKIARGDPAYRGVGERVARLGGGPGRPPGEGPGPVPDANSTGMRAKKR